MNNRKGDPWCAIFVNACLEAVGVRGTRSAMARSFERDRNFLRLSGPALGAIATMWTGTGHVFFYLGESEQGVLALGGNQSDRVLPPIRAARSRGRLLVAQERAAAKGRQDRRRRQGCRRRRLGSLIHPHHRQLNGGG